MMDGKMKATPYWVLLLLACFFSQIRFAICRTMTVLDYGAVPGETIEPSVLLSNCRAFQEAFDSAVPGDVLVVPASHTFSLVGGIRAQNLINFTFALEGRLNCVHNLSLWPRSSEVQWMNGACKENCDEAYEDLIAFSNNTALTIRGSVGGESTVDGNGKHWWNDVLIGLVGTDRPVLISVSYCTGVVVENLHLLNGPHFHLWLSQLVDVEVRNVNVTVDRRVQQEIKRQLAQKFQREEINHALSSATLQPWDLNTDGIDVSGVNVHIHDCYVRNDDDSIAVKPAKDSPNFWTQASVVGALNSTANGPRPTECSENIIIENVELTGFGASVGSVGAKDSPQRACIRNVSWRNISMPNTGKGIYVKTNKGCTTKDGTPKTGSITNVRYENVHISNAKWIPIWIGPQQQHEPHTDLGQECSLAYPLVDHCPTVPCVTLSNIELINVTIDNPALSLPGVILGNESNPISGLRFDEVSVRSDTHVEQSYICSSVDPDFISVNSSPELDCGLQKRWLFGK